jgi:hypothetical protein
MGEVTNGSNDLIFPDPVPGKRLVPTSINAQVALPALGARAGFSHRAGGLPAYARWQTPDKCRIGRLTGVRYWAMASNADAGGAAKNVS